MRTLQTKRKKSIQNSKKKHESDSNSIVTVIRRLVIAIIDWAINQRFGNLILNIGPLIRPKHRLLTDIGAANKVICQILKWDWIYLTKFWYKLGIMNLPFLKVLKITKTNILKVKKVSLRWG